MVGCNTKSLVIIDVVVSYVFFFSRVSMLISIFFLITLANIDIIYYKIPNIFIN